MQNFDTIEQELNKMEMLQEKLDRKVKDAAVYKDVNEKLVSIIKIAFICVVLVVAIFSTALVITYSKAQQNLCDFLSNGSLCSEQTTNAAKQAGIVFKRFNEYDFYFVLNMLYSDNYGVFGNDSNTYIQLAKAWLEDIDVAEGKAWRYYQKVVKSY